MNSVLFLINKPAGRTSFDCIKFLKKKLNKKDLGHGGTLDKFATGLLPVFTGEGLKLVRFFQQNYPQLKTYWKSYEGTLKLGSQTATGDPEGAIIEQKTIPANLSNEQIISAMQSFISQEYLQMPPDYSAKKIQGQRASDLKRKGVSLNLKPVAVRISEFRLIDFKEGQIRFATTCSKGTYVRVLAQDLAKKIGSVGHLTHLCRTAIGGFNLIDASPLETIDSQNGLDLKACCSIFSPFSLTASEYNDLGFGRINDILIRLKNSKLPANVYCATIKDNFPVALFELTENGEAHFIRKFSDFEASKI